MPSRPSEGPVIVWFRDDLRLADHPALTEASQRQRPVLCIYVLETDPEVRPMGGASQWWLHHALASLAQDLERLGARLHLLRGPSRDLIPALARQAGASAVLWTRRYDPDQVALDRDIKAVLAEQGLEAASFNGQLLYEPWTLQTKTGGFFRVYSPFWRAAGALPEPDAPLKAPRRLADAPWPKGAPKPLTLASLALLPRKPDWAGGLRETWTPGESGARQRLTQFLDHDLKGYASARDRPDLPGTSKLSPHLRFGEVTPRQIVYAARHAAARDPALARDAEKFVAEIGWREFSYHLLFHAPRLREVNFQNRFDAFPWREGTQAELDAWRRGRTGYPIVDAGMRELWTTGTMHNRVRMLCASFLVKDLMVDWRVGEAWFWDTLCDADPANNPASWQWVAGSGADAAPYFRVFNPSLQAAKFDPDGVYVRKFVPELARLPAAWIHRPWEAPASILDAAGLSMPRDYPHPIVDHGKARDRALAAFSSLKDSTS
jgi:deoxyribodipyrimidine photo-lyase